MASRIATGNCCELMYSCSLQDRLHKQAMAGSRRNAKYFLPLSEEAPCATSGKLLSCGGILVGPNWAVLGSWGTNFWQLFGNYSNPVLLFCVVSVGTLGATSYRALCQLIGQQAQSLFNCTWGWVVGHVVRPLVWCYWAGLPAQVLHA